MKAVVFAGGVGMTKCPLSLVRPRPLFPLVSDVVLGALLRALYEVDIDEAMICANGKTSLLRKHFLDVPAEHAHLEFHDDELPRGTAGCLKDVADFVRGGTFLAVDASLFLRGDLGRLLDDHRRLGAALTVASVPAQDWMGGDGEGQSEVPMAPLGIYVAEPDILEHIPDRGYFDIKEQLLPALRKEQHAVSAARFRGQHRRVADAGSYARLVYGMLSGLFGNDPFALLEETAPCVWVSRSATVDRSAIILGPVVIGPNSVIGAEAILAGPVLIREDVVVGEKAFVSEAIVWPRVSIGYGARVEHAILTDGFGVGASRSVLNSVAVDHALNLGDLHGLKLAGYGVGTLGRAGAPMLALTPSQPHAFGAPWGSPAMLPSGKKAPGTGQSSPTSPYGRVDA